MGWMDQFVCPFIRWRTVGTFPVRSEYKHSCRELVPLCLRAHTALRGPGFLFFWDVRLGVEWMYHIARGGLAFLRTFQTVLQRDWTLFFFFHSHRRWQGFRLPRTRVGGFILAVPAGAELRLAVLWFSHHPRWLVTLSLFSCAYSSSVCLLWRSVYTRLLPVFKLDF